MLRSDLVAPGKDCGTRICTLENRKLLQRRAVSVLPAELQSPPASQSRVGEYEIPMTGLAPPDPAEEQSSWPAAAARGCVLPHQGVKDEKK